MSNLYGSLSNNALQGQCQDPHFLSGMQNTRHYPGIRDSLSTTPPKKIIPMNGKISVVTEDNTVEGTFDNFEDALEFSKKIAAKHVGKYYIYECVSVIESSHNVEVTKVELPLLR